MHRGSDRIAEREWLDTLREAADGLELPDRTVAVARDLYLAQLPLSDRSKPAVLAASCYTATLITGEERSQTAVAAAFDVSRITVQQRWKPILEETGLSAPGW